jgi:hypothetical protein
MILKIGRQEITMTPVGTLLIGAKGGVEVVGPAGRTRLLLVSSKASGPTPAVETPPKKIKWAWKIATSAPPSSTSS